MLLERDSYKLDGHGARQLLPASTQPIAGPRLPPKRPKPLSRAWLRCPVVELVFHAVSRREIKSPTWRSNGAPIRLPVDKRLFFINGGYHLCQKRGRPVHSCHSPVVPCTNSSDSGCLPGT